jgi:hypothetical protein
MRRPGPSRSHARAGHTVLKGIPTRPKLLSSGAGSRSSFPVGLRDPGPSRGGPGGDLWLVGCSDLVEWVGQPEAPRGVGSANADLVVSSHAMALPPRRLQDSGQEASAVGWIE